MTTSAEIAELRKRGRLREAVEAAAAVFKLNSEGHAEVWQEHFLGPKALPWDYARQALQQQGSDLGLCRGSLQRLLGQPVYAAQWGSFAADLLEGMVRSIQAACCLKQDLDPTPYAEQAADAYQRAFACWEDPALGQAIVADVVARLVNPDEVPRPLHPPADISILLVGVNGWFVRLEAEAVKAGSPRLLPDPLRLGLTNLDEEFLKAWKTAWDFTREQPYGKRAMILRWGWKDAQTVTRVQDASGGAAMAAVARAALTGQRLDPRTAISACLRSTEHGWQLGSVLGDRNKRRAANEAWCDRVLFATGGVPAANSEKESASPVEVSDFEEAWEHLTGRRRALEALAGADRAFVLERLKRFRSPQLHGLVAAGDLAEVMGRLHVPFQVLTKVRVPRDDTRAFFDESQRNRGQDATERLRRKVDERIAPSGAEERFSREEREEIHPFDYEFAKWLADWRPGADPLVVLGDPGYGKTWLTCLLTLRRLRDYLTLAKAAKRPRLPLRLTCREVSEALDARDPDLVAAVQHVLTTRLGQNHQAERETLRQLLAEAVQGGRALLILDAWDEQDGGVRLQQALTRCQILPVVVTSRVIGRPSWLQQDRPWMLLALKAPGGVEDLVHGWFGPDHEARARELLAEIQGRPQLLQMVRVPLLGALVCWLDHEGTWKRAEERTRTFRSRSLLLKRCLWELLAHGCREEQARQQGEAKRNNLLEHDPGESVADDLMTALSILATETFTGERWRVPVQALKRVLANLPPTLQHLAETGFDYYKALTGRFGVFTEAGTDTVEILHQSFTELLVAWRIKEAFFPSGLEARWVTRRFRRWLRGEASLRLLDPRWHEVWVHLAGLLPDATPLVEELWQMDRRASWWRRRWTWGTPDDVFGTALRLAAHCLTAALNQGNGKALVLRQSPLLKPLEARLFSRWKAEQVWNGRIHTAVLALGQAGSFQRLLELVKDDSPTVRYAATEALGELGPQAAAAAVAPLVARLGDDYPTVRYAAAVALARICNCTRSVALVGKGLRKLPASPLRVSLHNN